MTVFEEKNNVSFGPASFGMPSLRVSRKDRGVEIPQRKGVNTIPKKEKLPEITFRHGPCSASIFATEYERGGDRFVVRSVCFRKRYRDANGEWKETNVLTTNDIPKATLVLAKCYEYLTANGYCERNEE